MSTSKPHTLPFLVEWVKGWIEYTRAQFETPEDDWPPFVLFTESEKGINAMLVPGEMMEFGVTKDLVASIIKSAMQEFKVLRFVLMMNVHGMFLDKDDPHAEEVMQQVREEGVRIQNMPGAREALMLVYGDAEEEHSMIAQIHRHESAAPTLGEWEGEAKSMSGRFAGLNEALR